jgi:hypothetical protein
MEITRRDLIRVSATMTVLGVFGRTASAMGDALPSWNDGPAKKASLASAKETTELSETYGPAGGLPETHVGTFTDELMAEAKQIGWVVISMKDDWKRIFAFDK